MNKKIAVTLVLVVILASFLFMPNSKKILKTENQIVKKIETTAVKTAPIKSQINIDGYLDEEIERIDANIIQGKVLDVYVSEGKNISKNAPLLKLDTTGEINSIDFQIKQLDTALSEANLLKLQLEKQKEKIDTLYDQGAVAKEEVTSMDNQLKQYINQVVQFTEQKNQLIKTRNNLNSRSIILSPCDGKIKEVSIVKGTIISPEDKIEIKKNTGTKVTIYVTEKHLKNLEIGKSVDVFIESENRYLKGEVSEILDGGGAELLYPVKIKLNNDESFRNGLSAVITLSIYENDNALLVPTRAVINFNNKSTVFKVVNDKAALCNVTTGVNKDGYTEILSGLNSDDTVIVKGQFDLKDGDIIR